MTWTKFGSEFFPECLHTGLSDAAVRTHCEAIAYLYEVEEMRCQVPKRLVRTFTGSDRSGDAIKELVEIGWWSDGGEKWVVNHHADVVRQSIAAQQKKRSVSKATSARYRAKQEADEGRQAPENTTTGTTGVTRHVTPDADRQTDKHLEESGPTSTCAHGVRLDFWTCHDCEQRRSA